MKNSESKICHSYCDLIYFTLYITYYVRTLKYIEYLSMRDKNGKRFY